MIDNLLKTISDEELIRRLAELLRQSRHVESELIAHIAELDERRLYTTEACPSMFAYCTEVLQMSEHGAYLRIAVARASRKHPMLLAMLRDGRLHLSGIAKLAPYRRLARLRLAPTLTDAREGSKAEEARIERTSHPPRFWPSLNIVANLSFARRRCSSPPGPSSTTNWIDCGDS